jgi:hypothetical protein
MHFVAFNEDSREWIGRTHMFAGTTTDAPRLVHSRNMK